MSAEQRSVATAALGVANAAGASTLIMVAMIYAGIGETSLSPTDTWSNSSSQTTTQEATAWLNGGSGFGAGGLAISKANPTAPAWWVANDVERNAVFGSPASSPWPGSTQAGSDSYFNQSGGSAFMAEAEAIVAAFGGGTLPAGGVAGAGGSGTSPNSTATQSHTTGFTMGTTSSPHQDMWTTINQLAQARQWYLFSDGETLYLADGPDLLQQAPALSIDRWGDASRIIHLDFTWDNTAYQYTVNRKKARARTVRKSVLSKVQSPTTATLDVICDIDEVRAGDVVYLSGCGPGNGKWLVGDCVRSVFQIYSELTLVPPMAPLTEKQAAGAGSSGKSGAAAGATGSGAVMQMMISAATTITNANLPYVWGGGHGTAGTPSVGIPGGPGFDGVTKGYDCSGAVGAVLHAGGLIAPKSVPASGNFTPPTIPLLIRGQGSGSPECTIFQNSGHVFMRLDGQYFGTSIGGGNTGRVNTSSGPTWWKRGTPAPDVSGGSFTAWHFGQSTLGKVIGPAGGAANVRGPSMQSNSLPSGCVGPSRTASAINAIVLHSSEIAGGSGYVQTLMNALETGARLGFNPVWDPPGTGLSVHCCVNTDGTITRLMPDLNIAYGASYANPYSLQIEQAGFASQGSWPTAQTDATANLMAYWAVVFGIPLHQATPIHVSGSPPKNGVMEHSQIDQSPKSDHGDPGAGFPFDAVLNQANSLKSRF